MEGKHLEEKWVTQKKFKQIGPRIVTFTVRRQEESFSVGMEIYFIEAETGTDWL